MDVSTFLSSAMAKLFSKQYFDKVLGFINRNGLVILIMGAIVWWMHSQNSDLKAKIANLESEIKTLTTVQAGKDELNAKLFSNYEKLSDLQTKQLEDAKAGKNPNTELQKMIDSQKSMIRSILKEKEEKDNEISALNQRITNIFEDLQKEKEKNTSLQQDKEGLVSKLNQANTNYDEVKKQNEKLIKDNQILNQKIIELEGKSVKPIQASTIKISPYINGFIDPDNKLDKSLTAKKITQVRVVFQLDRKLELVDNIYAVLINTSFKRTEIVNKQGIGADNKCNVDFVINKKQLSEGVLKVEIYNGNTLIGNNEIMLK